MLCKLFLLLTVLSKLNDQQQSFQLRLLNYFILDTLSAQSTQNVSAKLALSKHDVVVIIDETVNVDMQVT